MQYKNLPNITTNDLTAIISLQLADGSYANMSLIDLKALIGSSNTGSANNSGSSTLTKTLTYTSDGDINGLFYWIGTKQGTQAWVNPHTANLLIAGMSSSYNSDHFHPEYLFDRQPNSSIATANIPNSFYEIGLLNSTIKPNYYSLRARNFYANNPTGWKVLFSETTANWDELDSVTNTPLAQNQWVSRPLTATKDYKYIKIVAQGASTSGDNIFCIGEFEVYGTYKSTS